MTARTETPAEETPAPESATRTGMGAAVLDYYRGDERHAALLYSLMDPSALVRGGKVSPVDQLLARFSTLMEFANLVEVEVIAVPDDLVNTPFDCNASCEAPE